MTMRSRRERLVIENVGSAPAENLEVQVEPVGDGAGPTLMWDGPIERVLPHATVDVPTLIYSGIARQWRVTFRWQEGDESFEESQSVTR
jgi:hypothetical protein